ncbi:MAG: McrB family protein [Aureispira sp.]
MTSKKQLVQYLKQFPSLTLVEDFLKVLRLGLEQLSIKEDAPHLFCWIQEDNNALYVQLNNRPILVHQLKDRQQSIGLLIPATEEKNNPGLQSFQRHKRAIEGQVLGLAYFTLSRQLLTDSNLLETWLQALQLLQQQPKKKQRNRNMHQQWLYQAAMDPFVNKDILAAIAQKNPYQSIVQKALQELLQRNDIQHIQMAQEFWFLHGQLAVQHLQKLPVEPAIYEHFLVHYQAFKGSYAEFVAQLKGQPAYDLAIAIGKVIAYLDDKAANKQAWNAYADKRTLGKTGIRQDRWVKQLLAYRQANNDPAALQTEVIRHAVLYLLHPEEHSPILRRNNRRAILNNLLHRAYQAANFDLQLRSYFSAFDLPIKNYSNYTHLLAHLLQTPPVYNIWYYTEEDIYQEELLGQQANEPRMTYQTERLSTTPLNQILYGPPGCGKTYESLRRALALVDQQPLETILALPDATVQTRLQHYLEQGRLIFTTFHQSMSYEDFVEGIKPIVVKEQVQYAIEEGVLKRLAKQAQLQPELPFVLIIDELNRGNVANIFGELITLLEEDKRLNAPNALQVQLPYSKENFALPPNLYVLATMNSSDRSIEQLDLALRRRFSFLELVPRPDLLAQNVEGIDLQALLKSINQRIAILLDRQHLIGHAYLMQVYSLEDLQQVFQTQLLPLLLEYFYGDLGKLGLVLGRDFLTTKAVHYEHFADFDYEGLDRSWDRPLYELADFPLPKNAYINIYA